ncbi:hypothetical protein Sste5346_002969 [Sporothrix stenoceras]|uniref:Uncharacterized protein n=1 Tax=Sporothrix stenoceras TaxID=5173 RepID=A0ABR3ZH95_9PEZI
MRSGSGRACTSIVTEYHPKQPGQDAPFLIEVEYLNKEEMKEHLKELLWNYRRVYLPDINAAALGDAEYQQLEAASNTAWFTLQTAFRHENAFSATFAKDMSDGADDRILDQLIAWSDQIEWPQGSESGYWTTTEVTADACTEATRPFMEDKFWPFTKIIRVYLSSRVLDAGIVLADLPGLRDVNLARVRATQQYISRCDSILIVGRISRAISDQSLQSSLFMSLASQAPTEWQENGGAKFNIAVVCTHAEDIHMQTERRKLKDAAIESELTRLDGGIQSARDAGNLREELSKRLQ